MRRRPASPPGAASAARAPRARRAPTSAIPPAAAGCSTSGAPARRRTGRRRRLHRRAGRGLGARLDVGQHEAARRPERGVRLDRLDRLALRGEARGDLGSVRACARGAGGKACPRGQRHGGGNELAIQLAGSRQQMFCPSPSVLYHGEARNVPDAAAPSAARDPRGRLGHERSAGCGRVAPMRSPGTNLPPPARARGDRGRAQPPRAGAAGQRGRHPDRPDRRALGGGRRHGRARPRRPRRRSRDRRLRADAARARAGRGLLAQAFAAAHAEVRRPRPRATGSARSAPPWSRC